MENEGSLILPKDLEPSTDRILWRYMDVPRLIDILLNGCIRLIRIKLFNDEFEGFVLKKALSEITGTTEFGLNFTFDMYKMFTYASCWCESKHELASMWERFSCHNGVAIKTNAKLLLDNFESGFKYLEDHDMGMAACAKYIAYIDDYNDADIGSINPIDLFCYKMSDFRHENEVRIIATQMPESVKIFLRANSGDRLRDHLEPLYNQPPNLPLFSNLFKIDNLITEIIISPSSDYGMVDTVKSLVDSVSLLRQSEGLDPLNIPVNESRRSTWH